MKAISKNLGMRSSLICLALVLASVRTALATEPPVPWDFADADKQQCSVGPMKAMNDCIADAYSKADAQLAKLTGALSAALKDSRRLKRANTAWLRYRDAQCAFELDGRGAGSLVAYSRHACLIDHTRRRIYDLMRVQPCNGCVEFKLEFYLKNWVPEEVR